MPIRFCQKGLHITGFRNCPMCGGRATQANPPLAGRGAAPTVDRTVRQYQRRENFKIAMAAVNKANLRGAGGGLVGMSRSKRRNLARAYAKGLARKAAA